MTSVLKVDTIQNSSGGTATADGLGITAITVADIWHLTSSPTADKTPLTSWKQSSGNNSHTNIGTSMSVATGVFTFPATGKYLVTCQADITAESASTNTVKTRVSTDGGSSFVDHAIVVVRDTSGGDSRASAYSQCIVDVTDTSNVVVRFDYDFNVSGSSLTGSGNNLNQTSVMFMRLGAT